MHIQSTKDALLTQQFLRFLQKWGQSLFPFFYLILVLIGMLFEYAYYQHFNINIFAYSDVLDFLLAPAKDIAIIVFTLISFGLVLLVVWWDNFLAVKTPKIYKYMHMGFHRKPWFNTYRTISFYFVLLLYAYMGAMIYGEARAKAVKTYSKITVYFQANDAELDFYEATLIGKNKDYLFLLDSLDYVRIVPSNSQVKEIRLDEKFTIPD